jgi:ABC-type dipeptide/oligopeptide/nickel transport system permease subunit
MTGKLTPHYEWMMKSARIGALLGGVAGFVYGSYSMATSHALHWTDISDAMESVVVVLVIAVMIGSLSIATGWLAGLVLGVVSFPVSSFTKNARILAFRVKRRKGNIEKRDRAS